MSEGNAMRHLVYTRPGHGLTCLPPADVENEVAAVTSE
jgi:hypothetical protein